MDMLFRRYANPLPLLDGMIRRGKFASFIRESIEMHNRDEEEKLVWEMWLHKCFDKGYSDFRKSIGIGDGADADMPSNQELVQAVATAAGMLESFRLDEEKVDDEKAGETQG